MTQVILGAGGDIGTLLAKELRTYTPSIRLASRHPKAVVGDEELLATDLLQAEQVDRAVAGADIAYLVAGLAYDSRVWQRDWPLLMEHSIAACLRHGVKLVFFDNVYMYDPTAIPQMTEKSPWNPSSQKGKVRQQVAQKLLDAMAQRGLQAQIVRAADFYGPDSKNGILNMLVLNPFAAGKKPNWQADSSKVHSFTYTPDAAKATALLGNTDSAYQQVWHLPTSSQRWTGKDFLAEATAITGKRVNYRVLSPFLLRIAGLFDRKIRELVEMQYQNTQDYFFDSEKFCQAFDFKPTPYEQGIREVLTAATV